MCEHFFGGAIYLRIKEEPAFTCVSGACDNYTMVCICFSWVLPFSLSDLGEGAGGTRTGGQLSGVSNS